MNESGIYDLFVYGSLRSGFKSPVYEYISRFFTLRGEARVKGRLYDLGEYPAGVPVNEDAFIVGELYTVKTEQEFSWAIGQLDDYEGLVVEQGEKPLYRRELTDVHIDNTITKAWIYWYNGETQGRPWIESGDLLEYLKNK